MNASIQRRLLVWILAALSLGAAVLVLVSYVVTLEEMDEIFDENLKQVALAVASHHDFSQPGLARRRAQLPALASAYEQEGDFDFVTASWTRDGQRLYASDASVNLPFATTSGLTRWRSGSEDWHVYTIVLDAGVIQVGQRAASRRTLAGEAASELFVPLALLVGLIGVLLTAALRRGLQPLDRAADSVALRSAASLEPIDVGVFPREIHPLIRSINGLMQRLSEAFSAQRRFIADAAHELRSPVTALRLQVQLLERARDEPGRARAVAELKAGIERSQRLIEQLLRLSRVEPDAAADHAVEPVDLAGLVREAVGQLSTAAEEKGTDLGADAVPGTSAMGDRGQLLILLDNLVGNAIRYTPPGGTIDVRACTIEGRPALQVVDSGPGIPEAERDRVFDRFYRGQGGQGDLHPCGSGLGLAIVQAIAQRHGAAVSLHTPASGRGLEVRVVFAAGVPRVSGLKQ